MIKDDRKQDTAFMRQVLAKNLRYIRKERKLSQEKVEEMTGVSTNEIGKMEGGRTSVGLDTITALATGLDIEVKWLLDPEMDPAAVFSSPEEDVMEEIRQAMRGLPPDEQRHIARMIKLQGAHYRTEVLKENKTE